MSNGISPLEQEQTLRLAEIGAQLRELREESLLSLEQVSAKTMIQQRLLVAIEEGQFSKLPEPVYIQGFIKRYANALGADGDSFARAFPIMLETQTVQPSWKNSPAAQLRPTHLYVAYALLVIGAIGGLSYLLSRSTAGLVTASPPPALPSPSSGGSTSATPKASASPSPAASPISDKPVRVQMTLTAESWVRVIVDNNKELEEVLKEGTERSWVADREISIRAGNPAAVMLSFNEGQAKPMGQPGVPETVIFSADSKNQAASLPPRSPASPTP